MTTKTEALKLALEALENIEKIRVYEDRAKHLPSLEDKAITAIKEALSQPAEQEPVGKLMPCKEGWFADIDNPPPLGAHEGLLLYTSPPAREPLTRGHVKEIMTKNGYNTASPQERADFINGIRHAEAAHGIKEKNT